jgi:hypothetical protein
MAKFSVQVVGSDIVLEARTLEEAVTKAPAAMLKGGLRIFVDREYSAAELDQLERQDQNWQPEVDKPGLAQGMKAPGPFVCGVCRLWFQNRPFNRPGASSVYLAVVSSRLCPRKL